MPRHYNNLGNIRRTFAYRSLHVYGIRIRDKKVTFILPLVADCLPIHDEICKRVISYKFECVLHDSELIKNVASYGVLFVRTESPIGRNIMLCLKGYRISLTEFLSGRLSARFVIKHTRKLQSEITRTHSQLLREAIELRDGRLKFSDTELCLGSIELQYLINYIATF
jgi:hypothetical protein